MPADAPLRAAPKRSYSLKRTAAPAPQSRSDAAQGYGLKQTQHFERTPKAARDQRAAYAAQPLAQREELVHHAILSAAHPITHVQNLIIGEHLRRVAQIAQDPSAARRLQRRQAADAALHTALDGLANIQHLEPVHHGGGGLGVGAITDAMTHPATLAGDLITAARKSSEFAAGPAGLILGESVGRAAQNIGIAALHHPAGVAKGTVSGLAKTALDLPGGLAHAATQSPIKTVKEIGADYVHRYGESDKQMQQRFAKEGIASELFDALGAYGGAGNVAGKLAKGSELMSAARPALRTSGGLAKAQDVSGNIFHAAAQRVLDQARLARQERLAGHTSYEEDLRAPAHVIAAHDANRAAGSTVEVAPLHGAGKAQRVAVAKTKSRAVQMLKSEQHRRIEQHARPILNGLNKHERNAFYAVAEGWAPADAAHAPAYLQARRQNILANRKAEGIDNVRKRVDEVHKIDSLLAHTHEAFTPKLAEAVRKLRSQDIHVSALDPGLTTDQAALRRFGPQARALGLRRGELGGDGLAYQEESVPAFLQRVQHEADKHGLERPLYFPHEADSLLNNPDFASRAVGGARAVNGPHSTAYKLFDRGTRDTSPAVYLTGLARSIKRKHNWDLVADQHTAHVLPGMANKTLGELKAELRDHGIDPKDVAFWNPGRYHRALQNSDTVAHELPNRYSDATTPAEEHGVEAVQHALKEATHEGAHPVSSELAQTTGWSVVPKAAHDEIMASTKPSGFAGRAVDIANSKQSRLLLGINPAWNAFQVLSNVGLGALATGGKLPLRLIEQQRLYSKLSPEARDRIDALVGEGGGTHGQQVHLGATSKGRVIGRYRNLKASPSFDKPLIAGHGPTARQLNPMDAGFAFDRLQNKHFRRAVLVDSIKRDAKSLDPKTVEQMLRDPALAERHAQNLDKWLGDYTSYTHRERMGKRGLLFYGYLRHSLNVVLHTLPVEHPLTTAILAKVSELQQDELKKLGLGDLPWANGKFYFTKGGQLQSIDLGRANPLANAVTQIHGPGDALGLTPPVVQMVADQLYHRDAFRDKSWAVYGHPASATANLKGSYFDPARLRILANQVGELSAPYRIAEKMTEFGPQGADSLPWSQRPTTYKRADYKRLIKKQAAQDRNNASLLQQLAPFLPHPTRDLQVAKALANNAPGKAKKKSKGYFHKSKGYKLGRSSSGYKFGS